MRVVSVATQWLRDLVWALQRFEQGIGGAQHGGAGHCRDCEKVFRGHLRMVLVISAEQSGKAEVPVLVRHHRAWVAGKSSELLHDGHDSYSEVAGDVLKEVGRGA